MFKIVKGFDINAEDYLTFDQSNITRRRNSFKIAGKRFTSKFFLMYLSYEMSILKTSLVV